MIKELPLKNDSCEFRVISTPSGKSRAAHVPRLTWHYSCTELGFQKHVAFRCFPSLSPQDLTEISGQSFSCTHGFDMQMAISPSTETTRLFPHLTLQGIQHGLAA